jgi:hypothetical protein
MNHIFLNFSTGISLKNLLPGKLWPGALGLQALAPAGGFFSGWDRSYDDTRKCLCEEDYPGAQAPPPIQFFIFQYYNINLYALQPRYLLLPEGRLVWY